MKAQPDGPEWPMVFNVETIWSCQLINWRAPSVTNISAKFYHAYRRTPRIHEQQSLLNDLTKYGNQGSQRLERFIYLRESSRERTDSRLVEFRIRGHVSIYKTSRLSKK